MEICCRCWLGWVILCNFLLNIQVKQGKMGSEKINKQIVFASTVTRLTSESG